MPTVRKICGLSRPTGMSVKRHYYGIEIELEGIPELVDDDYNDLAENRFQVKEDSSLVNGLEFVSSPLDYEEVEKRLTCLEQILSDKGIPREQSLRTSVHVHVDVQLLTEEELARFVCGYYMLEKYIFSLASPVRKKSNFCIPYSKQPKDIYHFLDNVYSLPEIRTLLTKYRSLNLTSLFIFGTVECRVLDGTYSCSRIMELVNTLHWIKMQAITDSSFDNVSDWANAFYKAAMLQFRNPFPKYMQIAKQNLCSIYEEPERCQPVIRNPVNIAAKYIKEITEITDKATRPKEDWSPACTKAEWAQVANTTGTSTFTGF